MAGWTVKGENNSNNKQSCSERKKQHKNKNNINNKKKEILKKKIITFMECCPVLARALVKNTWKRNEAHYLGGVAFYNAATIDTHIHTHTHRNKKMKEKVREKASNDALFPFSFFFLVSRFSAISREFYFLFLTFFFDSLLSYYLQVSCSPKWPHREQTNSSTLQSWKRMAHRVFAGEGKLKTKKRSVRGGWERMSFCFFFPLLCSSTCVPLKKNYHLRIYMYMYIYVGF